MKYLLITTLLLLLPTFYFSQDTITTKVIVFDEEDMSKYDDESSGYAKNTLKLNPFLYFNGEIPIYYERALTKSFSIEAAIGITYKDYIGNLFDDSDNNYGNPDNDEIHPQPSFKLGLRYYTGGYVLEDFYFAVEFAHRKYSITKNVEYNFNNTQIKTDLKEEDNINEFKLIIGSQVHNYWDNFFIDYYGGVGIKNQSSKEIVDYNPDTNTNYIAYRLEDINKSKPAFYLGLKFGFEF